MPKGSLELTNKRKNEILDACEAIYRSQGFYGVTVKEISTKVSMTRPAIYHYFETKEEILLALLIREYDRWCSELEAMPERARGMTRDGLSELIAGSLDDKDILLRILNMNLYEIELNSRTERLADFKVQYKRCVTALHRILRGWRSDVTDGECDDFTLVFSSFLFGVYPFTKHTEKQAEAMRMAGFQMDEPSIHEMVRKALLKVLPQD